MLLARRLATKLGLTGDYVRIRNVGADASKLFYHHPREYRPDHLQQVLQVSVRLRVDGWLSVEPPIYSLWGFLANTTLLTPAVTAALGIVIAALAVRHITQPFRQLDSSAERFGRDESVAPMKEAGPNDVRRAIRAVNLMSARVSSFIEDRTRILTAVSHHLRTPITALKIRSEMSDDDDTRNRMKGSLTEMAQIVESTSAFLRAETAEEQTHVTDFVALLQQTVGDTDPDDAHPQIKATSWTSLPHSCRPVTLASALRNLLDTALRYGGQAEVSLRSDDDAIQITIDDRGPGIPAAQREAVFRPFRRQAHLHSSGTTGTGLGLPVACDIMGAHGGDVTLHDSPAGGLRERLRCPSAPDRSAADRSDTAPCTARTDRREVYPGRPSP